MRKPHVAHSSAPERTNQRVMAPDRATGDDRVPRKRGSFEERVALDDVLQREHRFQIVGERRVVAPEARQPCLALDRRPARAARRATGSFPASGCCRRSSSRLPPSRARRARSHSVPPDSHDSDRRPGEQAALSLPPDVFLRLLSVLLVESAAVAARRAMMPIEFRTHRDEVAERHDRTVLRCAAICITALVVAVWPALAAHADDYTAESLRLDALLSSVLQQAGFTGRIESTLETRLGRPIDPKLANLGRLLFFDRSGAFTTTTLVPGAMRRPTGFGDTQSIAIGVQNNNIVGQVGRGRGTSGEHPLPSTRPFIRTSCGTAGSSRRSGDPFDNSHGYIFPLPEGASHFLPTIRSINHLLIAQAHIPPTELVEVAGFTGTSRHDRRRLRSVRRWRRGRSVPPPDACGFRNEPIRQAVLKRLNASPAYRRLFGAVFPSVAGGPDRFHDVRPARSPNLSFPRSRQCADRQVCARRDKRDDHRPKKGALIFFGKGGCVSVMR